MSERLHPSVSMLAGEHSLDAYRLGRSLFGPRGIQIADEISRGLYKAPSAEDVRMIDAYTFSNMRGRYGEAAANPEALYRRSMDGANAVVNYIAGTAFPSSDQAFSLRNETIAYGASPFRRFLAIYDPANDPLTQHEARRQLVLADVVAQLDSRVVEDDLTDALSVIQRVAREKLYRNHGVTRPMNVCTVHDNETNLFRGWGFQPDDLPPFEAASNHVKQQRMVMRASENLAAPVLHADIRSKSLETSAVKALRKAIKNGGKIDPYQYVGDTLGMQFIIFGTSHDRDDFANHALEVFSTDSHIKLHPDAPYSRRDASSDGGPNGASSEHFSFSRIELNVQNLAIPIEMLFYTVQEYMNGKYHLGHWDDKKNGYDGAAHILLEQRRLMGMLPVLFPSDVYHADPVSSAIDNTWHTGRNLLQSDRLED